MQTHGLSEQEAQTVISGKVRDSTLATYESAWRRWLDYCDRKEIDFWTELNRHEVIRFFSFLFNERNLNGPALNTQQSAMNAIFELCDHDQARATMKAPVVERAISGFIKRRPPKPRYEQSVLLDPLINHLKELGPLASIGVSALRTRAICLMKITALMRSSDIERVDTSTLRWTTEGRCQFHLLNSKTSVGYSGVYTLQPYPDDPDLCPVANLREYMSRTEAARADVSQAPLFLDVQAKRAIGSQRIAKLCLQAMQAAGIKGISAHGLRMASASQLIKTGVSVDEVMSIGHWSSRSTFIKFYVRAYQEMNRNQALLQVRTTTASQVPSLSEDSLLRNHQS